MASFTDGKYILTNDYCSSKECLAGRFDKCGENHQYLIRSNLNSTVTNGEPADLTTKINAVSQPEQNSDVESEEETIYKEEFDDGYRLENKNFMDKTEMEIEFDNDNREFIISDSESETEGEAVAVYTSELARNNPQFNIVMQYVYGQLLLNEFVSDQESWKTLFQSIERVYKNSIIGYIDSIGLRMADLKTLNSETWLNDRIINASFLLLKEKTSRMQKSVEVVDTFWLSHYQVKMDFLISG